MPIHNTPPRILTMDSNGNLRLMGRDDFRALLSWFQYATDAANSAEDLATIQAFDPEPKSDPENLILEIVELTKDARKSESKELAGVKSNALLSDKSHAAESRRISDIEAANSILVPPVALQRQIDDLRAMLAFEGKAVPLIPKVTSGTRANRLKTAARPSGAVYYETDTKLYYIARDSAWRYLLGTWRDLTYADRNNVLVVAVGANDEGLLFEDATYLITWRYDGTQWLYWSGTYRAVEASKPAGVFGASEVGALFYSTNKYQWYRWSGSVWEFLFSAIDSPTFFVDPSTHRVGIGTTGPHGLFELADASPITILNSLGGAYNNWLIGLHWNLNNFLEITPSTAAGGFSFNNPAVVINGSNGKVGINTNTPEAQLALNGGAHIGGDSDPGDNNLLVDGTFGCNGASAQAPYASGGAAGAGSGTATNGGYGFVSAAEMNAFISAVNAIKDLANNIRIALANNGIMS